MIRLETYEGNAHEKNLILLRWASGAVTYLKAVRYYCLVLLINRNLGGAAKVLSKRDLFIELCLDGMQLRLKR